MKRIVFASALAAALAACGRSQLTGEQQVQIASEEQEIQVGREVAPQIEREFGGVYDDDRLQDYVEEVGGAIVGVCERSQMPYRFRVLDSKVLNAFSLPDGSVYITRGLLARMENENQLAAVLGHEVAHVVGRHAFSLYESHMLSQLGLTVAAVIAAATTSGNTRNAVGVMANVGSISLSVLHIGFSRENERESDTGGMRYTHRLGYDPNGMAQVLEILAAEQREQPASTLPSYLKTHPNPEERAEEIRRQIGALGPSPAVPRPDRFAERTASLKNGDAMTHYDKAIEHAEKGEFELSRAELDAAIQAAPQVGALYSARGQIHALQGLHDRALADFERGLVLNPRSRVGRFGRGAALTELGRDDEALPELASVTREDPTDYRAYYYQGLIYFRKRQWDDAEARCEIVVDLLGDEMDNPYRRNSINILNAIERQR